jgi:hypothetical protein
MRAFGCCDQLNHFLRTAKPILKQIGVGAECLHSELRGNARVGIAGVFGNESNFVQTNSARPTLTKMRFKPLRESATLRTGFHERAHKMRELVARNTWAKANACNVCNGQHIRETALGR